jgi:MEDS: MEthanogen/methylotroph, DcmR Sensory domain
MSEPIAEQPIHFAGATLGKERHVCAFFDGLEEEYRIVTPFLKEGIDRMEQIFYIVDPDSCADYKRRAEDGGLPLGELEKQGQAEVRSWEGHYVNAGRFDPDAALALIEGLLRRGRERFNRTRIVGHADWAAEDRDISDSLIEYESRLNYVLPNYPDTVICAYDVGRWNAGVLMDILRTHPVVMIRGVVHANPFFVPPDEFLREIRDRAKPASI